MPLATGASLNCESSPKKISKLERAASRQEQTVSNEWLIPEARGWDLRRGNF